MAALMMMMMMMNKVVLFFLLALLFLLPEPLLCVADSQFQACRNQTTCGGLNVSFPFFIRGRQRDFCGYPGFSISCSLDQPILNLSNSQYIIRGIDYQSQSLRVSNAAAVWNWTNSCESPWLIQNLTLPDDDRFSLEPDVTTLFLFYNCNSRSTSSSATTSLLSQRRVNCSGSAASNSSTLLGLYGDDPSMGEASGSCRSVVGVPVEGDKGDNMSGLAEALMARGFRMKWTASNCSICESSGGQCGFDYGVYQFKCFCPDGAHAWRCNLPPTTNVKRGISLGIVFGVGGMVLLLLSTAGLLFWVKKGRRPVLRNGKYSKSDRDVENFIKNYGSFAPKRFSYSSIKRMTSSFREKLGQGGFGAVYKGALADGTLVAVKLLSLSKGDGEDFVNEVASISRTSHVNVVGLLGFCFEGSKRALIYEYMPNGSLDKFIYDEARNLGCERLYEIAIGIARGLEYLHRGCNIRILHFDIKPQNILLDRDLCPKISDFGLSKLCLRRESIVSMLVARGTIGYIAPEVVSSNFGGVSHKSDVYSYGMMLIEMVGGRKNLNPRANRSSEVYFPDHVYRLVEQGHLGLAHGQILQNEIARKMALIGLWCIQADPSRRPSMSRVIEMLEGSTEALQIPPKPFYFSPARSQPVQYSSTTSSTFL